MSDRLTGSQHDPLGRLLRAAGHDLNNQLHVVLAAAAALGTADLNAEDQQILDDVRQAAQGAGVVVDRLYSLGRCLTEPPVSQDLLLLLAELEVRLATSGLLLVYEEPPECTVRLDTHAALRLLTDLSEAAADAAQIVTLTCEVAADLQLRWPLTAALRTLSDRLLDDARTLPTTQAVTVLTLRGILEHLGARLTVTADSVVLTLPGAALVAATTPLHAAAPEPLAEPTSRRALLVEDDRLVAEYLERSLARRGWDVTTATDGEHAWELVRSDPRPFALVVADVQMPRLRGDQFLQRLDAHGCHWPALVVTAFSHTEALDNLAALGHRVVLGKPFSDEMLDLALAQVLRVPPPPEPPPH